MRIPDPPQADPFDGRDEFVGGEANVVGIGAIDRILAGERQSHFFLGEGNEVDAAALFPFLPLDSADAGAVVGVEDFATGGACWRRVSDSGV